MTTNTNGFTARASVAAVRGALIAMALAAYTGHAAAQSGQELTKPTSTTEIGAGDVSDGSYKAGEYNGLEKKGGFGIGNIDWRGGGAFDSDSALRWRIKGIDLGLETRSLYGEVGVQGKFRLNARLRPAAEEPIRQLPDALQRRRVQCPHLARHVAGADRGRKQWQPTPP